MIKVIGTSKIFPSDESRELKLLSQFVDYLSPEVRAVTFDNDGLITGVSTDASEDETIYIPYFPLASIPSLSDCRTIQYSKLHEVDR